MFRIAACVTIGATLFLATAPAAQIGSVLRAQRLSELDASLAHDDYLGDSLTALGDLDGDGVTELAVGAPHFVDYLDVNTEAGSVWILFLRADGTLRSFTQIGRGLGGFTGTLPDAALFGASVEAVGDLDGDGLAELCVSSSEPNPAAPNRRPIGSYAWVLFLDSAGQVRRHARIDHTDPVFQPAIEARNLFSLAGAPGDTDADGVPDLALGAILDDGGPGADLGAFWLLRLNPDGTAKSALRIGHGAVPLEEQDRFGRSVSPLGDIDGDGLAELAVAAAGADDGRGSLWVLSMRPDQSVARALELDRDDFDLVDSKLSAAAVGDLDGDRVSEVVVTLPDYITGQPARDVGGLLVTFLARDGSVRKRLVITRDEGGFDLPLPQGTGFGRDVELLGDLDRDGNPEIATGGVYFNDDRGTVWILSLRTSAVRKGSGVNTVELSQKADPAIGLTWHATLDCSGLAPGVAQLRVHEAPQDGVLTPAGELLVAGAPILLLQRAHAGTPASFDVRIPRLTSLVNRSFHAQGLCTDGAGARLSNALDVLVGR